MTPETAAFVELMQKLGVPAFVILLVAMSPVFVPLFVRILKAKTRQTETMTATLPRIETHLHDMARSGSASQNTLEELLRGQNRHEAKLDKLLERRP